MEIESGQGLAGGLLKNEEMRLQFQAVLTNLNGTAIHFSNLASNLNARGIFYKPNPSGSSTAAQREAQVRWTA